MRRQQSGKSAVHDAIGRRLRERRVPNGKVKRPTARSLIWLEKLYRHGPLPSSYLHAFTRHLCRNEAWSRRELADLFHEDSVHGRPYLDRPWQQFNTMDARHNDLVYDIAEAGVSALREAGLASASSTDRAGPWVHRCMIACITASIELAAIDMGTLRFLFRDAITKAPPTVSVPVSLGSQRQERALIPDAIFALAYRTERGERYRLFALEADRGTEPGRYHAFHRKSYLRTVLQYREYVGRGLYKSHLGLSASMLVLNVTTSEARLRNLVSLVADSSPAGSNSFMLFQSLPSFGRFFKPPKLLPQLLHEPWLRAGHDPLRIDAA